MADGKPNKPTLGKVVGRSATSLTNLGVFGAAAVAAAALASWPILAIGGVAYGAMVAWDAANPDFWKRTFGARAPGTATLPDPATIKDPPLRAAVTAILAARAEIGRTLKETSVEVQANLVGAVAQIAELEWHAAAMVTRGEDLGAYLAKTNLDKVRAEVAGLDAKARATGDAEARGQYGEARRTREEQLQALLDLGDAHERICAKLAVIVATLEGLPPKIVRMRALDAQAMDELSGSVNDELARMNGEIKLFEETLKTMAEVPIT